MSARKAYYHWINHLKIAGIIGVVYIHANANPQLSLSTIYFRFGVPIFIISSFFLAERHALSLATELPVVPYLKKRVIRLLVPYLFWSSIYCWLKFRPSYPSIYKFLTVHWIGFGWAGQYYLIMMIQLTLIYPFVRKIDITSRKLFLAFFSTLLLLYGPLNYFNLSPVIEGLSDSIFIYWLFYMLFAIYIARHYQHIKNWLTSIVLWQRLALIVSLPLLMVIERILVSPFNETINPYFCISTLVASPLIFLLMADIDSVWRRKEPHSNKSFRLLSQSHWVSTLTLGIFCLNPLIIHLFSTWHPVASIYLNLNNISGLIAKTIAISLTAILVSSVLVKMGATQLVK